MQIKEYKVLLKPFKSEQVIETGVTSYDFDSIKERIKDKEKQAVYLIKELIYDSEEDYHKRRASSFGIVYNSQYTHN